MELEFNPDGLHKNLGPLTTKQQLAFLLSCCERMYRNYVYFSEIECWGKPEVFREALDLGWLVLQGENLSNDLRGLSEKCERWTPDTEDFGTIYCSSALDAAVSITLMLAFITDIERDKIVEIASLARDTVDMFVQESEVMDPTHPKLEENILKHPLMQNELAMQREDLRNFEQIDFENQISIEKIIAIKKNLGKSNIEL